jgi:hypothetical protein
MSKRFTDTEIWDKEWFMALSTKHKCLIRFLFDKCDQAGVWSANWMLASQYIGEKVTEDDLITISERVEKIATGKFFIVDFIEFQYGTLSENCKPHLKIIALLKKYELFKRVCIGYTTPLQRVEDKDKEKDKEEDKEKEEGGTGGNKIYRKFQHLKISENEFTQLLSAGYDQTEIDNILDAIENYKKNKSYTSLYLTAKKWLEKEKATKIVNMTTRTEKILSAHEQYLSNL